MRWTGYYKLLPWLTLTFGLAGTYFLQHAAFHSLIQAQQEEFTSNSREVVLRIEQRLQTYEHVLHGIEGFFSSTEKVNRDEFHNYVNRLRIKEHFPGIQSLSLSPLIPAREKIKHIESVRKEGFPNYTLHPEGNRNLYAPSVFIEPFDSINQRFLGYDALAVEANRFAMELSRDTDDAAMSDKIDMIQQIGGKPQAGFNLFMPMYRNGITHETLADRRANIIGWGYASFRMDDLLRGVLGEKINLVDLEIWDKDSISIEALMYDNDGIFSPALTKPALYNSTQKIKFLNHIWTVRVRSLPNFEAALNTDRVTIIQFAGTIISMLLSLLIWLLANGRERALKSAQELRIAATAFESQESLMITDAKRVILRVNEAFVRNTGYTSEEIVGKTPRLLRSGRHNAAFYSSMWKTIRLTGTWQGEIWDRRKNGEIYPKWLTITAVNDANGVVTNYVGAHIDITDQKVAEEKIQHLAFYDPLTHLPNRRLLMDRLQHALASSERSGRSGALLCLDLDNFKTLNDSLGHDIGDLLLQQVAQRLASCVREGDTVARLGGDEFMVVLEVLDKDALDAAAQIEAIGEKIHEALNQPYQIGKHQHNSTASIGITLFKGQRVSPEELMKQADIAMYQSKKSGRNTLHFFDTHMQASVNAHASLGHDLRQAIELQQFQLYYQIQCDEMNRPLGAEALIRWIHPERGFVSPMQFIPLAEETNLILPIGQWVLDSACAQLKIWALDALTRDLTLSVNVSVKQFREADFVAQVQAAVQLHAINPMLLKLELTESILVDDVEKIIATMNTLKQVGIQFSMDDFGTGYSSLQYLKRLPLTQLKIDMSFVHDMDVNGGDNSIVQTIIAMANSLNLSVIAEGVETEAQRQLLSLYGCHHYQGYLFSKPLPVAQFEALLKNV